MSWHTERLAEARRELERARQRRNVLYPAQSLAYLDSHTSILALTFYIADLERRVEKEREALA